MAQTEEQAPPRTIRVDGGSGPTLSWEYPPGVAIDVESVYAEIDASGAGDTTATVTVHDPSGVVIARKAQSQPIAGGAPGSATWALRLADEQSGGIKSVVSVDPELVAHPPIGGVVAIGRFEIAAAISRDAAAAPAAVASGALAVTTTNMRHNVATFQSGVTVDLASNPSRLVVQSQGLYLLSVAAAWAELGAADYGYGLGAGFGASPLQNPLTVSRRVPGQAMIQQAAFLVPLAAGAIVTQVLGQNSGGPLPMPIGELAACRLGPLP